MSQSGLRRRPSAGQRTECLLSSILQGLSRSTQARLSCRAVQGHQELLQLWQEVKPGGKTIGRCMTSQHVWSHGG